VRSKDHLCESDWVSRRLHTLEEHGPWQPTSEDRSDTPPELKERATRMVLGIRAQDPKDLSAITRVARQLGVGTESLRTWVKQAEIDAGNRGGLTTEERAEHRKAAQGEPRAAAVQRHLESRSKLLRGRVRPQAEETVAFSDAHRDFESGGRRWGVEPISGELLLHRQVQTRVRMSSMGPCDVSRHPHRSEPVFSPSVSVAAQAVAQFPGIAWRDRRSAPGGARR
jgi:transposase-like protein